MANRDRVYQMRYCCLTRRRHVIVLLFELGSELRIVYLYAIIRWTLGQQELIQEEFLRGRKSAFVLQEIPSCSIVDGNVI